jgi:hypothetical protein
VFPEERLTTSVTARTESQGGALAVIRKVAADSIKQAWLKAPYSKDTVRRDVIAGLLGRQLRYLLISLASPATWTHDVGKLVLRAVVDTYITASWLTNHGTSDDFEKFVEYGLGQEKLLMEHLRARYEQNPEQWPELEGAAEELQRWIEDERRLDFLPVDIGGWTKKSTYDMAVEADCKDLYNLAYTPDSAFVHGSWNALARSNTTICGNPLHGYHRLPDVRMPFLDPNILLYVGQICQESILELLRAVGVEESELTEVAKLSESISGVIQDDNASE